MSVLLHYYIIILLYYYIIILLRELIKKHHGFLDGLYNVIPTIQNYIKIQRDS